MFHPLQPEILDAVLHERREELPSPKKEMHDFIRTAVELLGPKSTGYLTELWLDELASMDYLPSPHSHAWKLVSLGASARLASRLIEVQLGNF